MVWYVGVGDRFSQLKPFFFCFFFSSRRRHTRFTSDWSSDVCSSDLPTLQLFEVRDHPQRGVSTSGPAGREERTSGEFRSVVILRSAMHISELSQVRMPKGSRQLNVKDRKSVV